MYFSGSGRSPTAKCFLVHFDMKISCTNCLTLTWPRGVELPPRPIFSLPFLNRSKLRGTLWWLFLNMFWLQNGTFSNYFPTLRSKMAAAKPVTNIFQFINNLHHGISGSVTPRNEIPRATPTFLESRNSMALLWILPSVSGSRNFKMAAVKPVIYIDIHIRNAHTYLSICET